MWTPHRRSVIAVLVAIALAAGAALGLPAPASAQDDGTMVLEFADPAEVFDDTARDQLQGWLVAVFADGELCARVPNPGNGAFSVVLGEAAQPEACGTPGAHVQFVNGHGHLLSEEETFEPNSARAFTNWAPLPPGTTYPVFVCVFLAAEGAEAAGCAAHEEALADPPPAAVGHGVGPRGDTSYSMWVVLSIAAASLLAARIAAGRASRQ